MGRGVRLTGLLRCRKTPLWSCRGRHAAAAALILGVPLVTRNADDPTDSATKRHHVHDRLKAAQYQPVLASLEKRSRSACSSGCGAMV